MSNSRAASEIAEEMSLASQKKQDVKKSWVNEHFILEPENNTEKCKRFLSRAKLEVVRWWWRWEWGWWWGWG